MSVNDATSQQQLNIEALNAKLKVLKKQRLDAIAQYQEAEAPSYHAAEKTFRRFVVAARDRIDKADLNTDQAEQLLDFLAESISAIDPRAVTAQQIKTLGEQVDYIAQQASRLADKEDAGDISRIMQGIKSELGRTFGVSKKSAKEARKTKGKQEKLARLRRRLELLKNTSSLGSVAIGAGIGASIGADNPLTRAASGTLTGLGLKAIGGLAGGAFGAASAPFAKAIVSRMTDRKISKMGGDRVSEQIAAKTSQMQAEAGIVGTYKDLATATIQSSRDPSYPGIPGLGEESQSSYRSSGSRGRSFVGGSKGGDIASSLASIDKNIQRQTQLLMQTINVLKGDRFAQERNGSIDEKILEAITHLSDQLGGTKESPAAKTEQEKKSGLFGLLSPLLSALPGLATIASGIALMLPEIATIVAGVAAIKAILHVTDKIPQEKKDRIGEDVAKVLDTILPNSSPLQQEAHAALQASKAAANRPTGVGVTKQARAAAPSIEKLGSFVSGDEKRDLYTNLLLEAGPGQDIAKGGGQTASGPGQITDGTFKLLMKKYPQYKDKLAAGRNDPDASALAMALLIKDNESVMKGYKNLGNSKWLKEKGITQSEINRSAYFLGPENTNKLYNAPDYSIAAEVVRGNHKFGDAGDPATQNPDVFYAKVDRDKNKKVVKVSDPYSVEEIKSRIRRDVQGAQIAADRLSSEITKTDKGVRAVDKTKGMTDQVNSATNANTSRPLIVNAPPVHVQAPPAVVAPPSTTPVVIEMPHYDPITVRNGDAMIPYRN